MGVIAGKAVNCAAVADVFISYATRDRDRANQFARALLKSKISVWSDPGIPARGAIANRLKADKIKGELSRAKCVLVLWSRHSVRSVSVRDQANAGHERGVLLPVFVERLDHRDVPSGSGAIPKHDLSSWNGDPKAAEFRTLLGDITRLASATSPHEAGRDFDIRGRTTPSREARAKRLSSKLFLCYRREDTQDSAGRLHDRLVDVYGLERVFMDIDSVPLGIDFVEHVTEQIGKCSAVIVMIGKQWHKIKDKKRRRRLDNEDDLVRAEIRAALQQKIPVIPVTVQNAAMPQADDLPDDIRRLARRNGIALRHDQWREGVERLLRELNPVMGRTETQLNPDNGTEARVVLPVSNRKTGDEINRSVSASDTSDTDRVAPRLRFEGSSGTARWDGKHMRSADIIVHNSGEPFTLVALAKLERVAEGFEWLTTDEWRYDPRLVKGGIDSTFFHIVTLEHIQPDGGRAWLAKVRGEHMVIIRKWEGSGELWFDVRWTFRREVRSRLLALAEVVTHVVLSQDKRAFEVTIANPQAADQQLV